MKHRLTLINRLYSFLFLSFFYLMGLSSVAQNKSLSVNVETLKVEDGLSQSVVYSVAQDAKGFMWFATFNGVDRYDGNEFLHFRHDDNDSFSISSSQIYSLLCDMKGRLWAGSWDKGLNYFDAPKRRWYHFLRGKSIYDLQEGGENELYVCDKETVMHLSIVPLSKKKENDVPFRIDTVTAKIPLPLHMTLVGDARLFSDRDKHIYLITQTELYSVQYDKGKNSMGVTLLKSYRRGWAVPSFLQDKNTGKFYLGNIDGIWESKDSRFANPVKIHDANQYYGTLYIDNRSRLWYNSGERLDTLNLLSGKEGLFTRLSNPTENVFAQLNALTQDRNGTLWFRTSVNGLITYADDENNFHTLLPGYFINPLCRLNDSSCLVNEQVLLNFGKNGIDTTKQAKSETDFFRNTLNARGANGEAWYIKDTMLVHYTPATSKRNSRTIPYRRFNLMLEHSPDLGSNAATVSYNLPLLVGFIDRDSCLWLHCPHGMVYYDIKKDSFHFINRSTNAEHFYLDKSGIMWMNADDGIYNYDKRNGTIRFFPRGTPAQTDALPATKTESVFCDDPLDPQHIIWMGTRNGLYRINKTTGSCRYFSNKNGLPDNLIYSLLPDEKEGNLWMSTSQGLSCISAATFSIRNFSEADGLQGREYNSKAALQFADGTMLFGGTQGLNYFHPEQIKPIAPPLTVLTGCSLFGEPVQKDAAGVLLAEPAYTKDISISYRDNVVGFSFAGIDYRKKTALQYRYKLVPFDKDWNYVSGSAHEATYTNLDPGDYTFTAEASNTNGIWGKESEPLQVHILPLWWQTWWCKVLVAIVILVALYSLYRYQLTKALEVARVRNRIASDLHDEVGSTLSAINLFSQMAHEQSKTATVSPHLLERINHTSQKVTQTMSDIVWSVSTKNDPFDKMITHMHEHAIQLCELKGYELYFKADDKLNGISLSMEKRQNFYLIYKETLNNIIKYANGNHVWINIRKDKSAILFSIKDDGVGFDTSKKNGGNGLQNMKQRAAAVQGSVIIHSAIGSGCEINVCIPI